MRSATKFRQIFSSMAMLCLLLPMSDGLANGPMEDRQAIYDRAKQFIHAELGESYRLEVQVGYLDKRLRLAKCQQKLEGFLPARKHPFGATTVGIRCPQPAWKVYVPVDIKAYTQVVTTTHPIPRGTILSDGDVAIEKREISRFRSGVFKQTSNVIGMKVRQPLAQGAVLTPRLVKPKRLVQRGQEVTILAESGGLLIRVKGEALMDGHHGQTVQVKNLRSGQKLYARVVAAQTVRVKM